MTMRWGTLVVALLCGCGAEMTTADAGRDLDALISADTGIVCEPACAEAQLCCEAPTAGRRCVNPFADPANCGGCGIVCDSGDICLDAVCRNPSASPDAGPPDAARPDAPIAPSCSPACGADFQCCVTTCVARDGAGDTSDPSFANCGGCGRACDATTADRCGRFGSRTTCMCGDGPACEAGARCQLASDGSSACM